MGIASIFLSLLVFSTTWADDKENALDLNSGYMTMGMALSLQDNYHTIYSFRLSGNLKPQTGGSGVLEFNPNGPVYDDFGHVSQGSGLPWEKYDCTFKFVKKGTVSTRVSARIGSEEKEVKWVLYEIKGPKITSKLFLALEQNEGQMHGRLLVHDIQGKVKNAVTVWGPDPRPQEPCHPECFPAGTKITLAA